MPFSLRKLTKLQLVALCLIVVSTLTALGINSQRLFTMKKNVAIPVAAPAAVQVKNKANPLGKGYIQRQGIWPQLRTALDAYGDRLEKPGKERLTAVGTISNASTTANEKVPVRLVFEFPDKLRIEKQKAGKTEITIFDGKTKAKIGDVIKPEEEAEMEALVFDSLDHFMAAHMQGQSLRYLGNRFRLDDGTTAKYTGSYYDIYQMAELPLEEDTTKKQSVQQKRYFFNSDTQQLARITYQSVNKNEIVEVVVELAGWQKLEGQVLPTSLTWFENGKPTLTLTIGTLTLSARANDGIFTNP